MATVTDELVTLFSLRGATSAINDFERISNRLQEVARDEGRVLTVTERLNLGVQSLGGQYVALAGAVAGVTALLGRSLAVFAADEQAIFRTTIVLNNLRSSLPIEELQQFAQELQRSVAIDDEAVVALGGLLARFGVAGQEIPAALRTIVDFSEGTGKSLEEVGFAVGRALQGQTRGLRSLAVEFKSTGDRARDLQAILEALDRQTAGAGAARRETLGGALQAVAESMNNLLSAMGERLTPAVIKLADSLTAVTDFLTRHADTITDAFFRTIGISPGARRLLGIADRQPNVAERVGGGGGGVATEDTLKEVAENTGKTANATLRLIQGGGALSAGALNFRGINAAIRNAR